MGYRTQGWLHAQLMHAEAMARTRLAAPQDGQGTVEYVALILLVGAIFAAVAAAGKGKHFNIAETIGKKLNEVIGSAGG